jgi:hypothetical protein
MMENYFIKLIREGSIHSTEDLKRTFRLIAKKTHPDTAGTDRYVKEFMLFMEQYEEALKFLHELIGKERKVKEEVKINYRLSFYRQLIDIYFLEGYSLMTKRKETNTKISGAFINGADFFEKWQPSLAGLCKTGLADYEMIKNEKQKNVISNIRKLPLFLNLRPILFNVAKYHITGLEFYKKQTGQNLDAVINRLEETGHIDFKEFLVFMINDMNNGPAIFDD